MRIRYVILRQLSGVLSLLLGKVIDNIAFLQEQIADVPLVV